MYSLCIFFIVSLSFKLANSQLGAQTKAGAQQLEGKKALIDQQLEAMKTELGKVSSLVNNLEKDREAKFGELTTQLKNASEQTGKLMQTTNKLHEVLASARARGQWGQRMAEDILRLAGFIENVNYLKEKGITEALSTFSSGCHIIFSGCWQSYCLDTSYIFLPGKHIKFT